MPQSLGTIYVDLQANTAGFVSALSKAAYTAQQSARDISRSFQDLSEVASQTFGAFGDFNPIVSKFSFAISAAGSAASSAMKQFSGMGGALGPLAALATGAAAGLGALAIGAAGIAAEAAESAAKLYELSQSTGVSVEALSALSFAAKQSGLDQETLVKSLQILSLNMLKAAQAAPGTSTAFSRLGLDVRQANGDLKDSGKFMEELIARLSEMKDKTAAVGFARQAMGRGGAAILQLGDPEELQHWVDVAQKIGVTSEATAHSAEKFEQGLGVLRFAAEAASRQLMEDMMPALMAVINQLDNAAVASDNAGSHISKIGALADTFKGLLVVLDAAYTGLESIVSGIISLAVAADTFNKGLITAIASFNAGDFRGVKSAWSDTVTQLEAISKDGANHQKEIWSDLGKFYTDVFAKQAPEEPQKPRTGAGIGAAAGTPEASGQADVVAELVAKLRAQADAELALASATEKSVAASLLAKAAGEAETRIAETRSRLLEQEKALREQLADAQAEETSGSAGAGTHAIKIQAEIAGLQKMLAELDKDAPQIKTLYAEIASGGFGAKASEDLEKFRVKTDEETAALQKMTAAYGQGPLAVQSAQEAAKIAPFEEQHNQLGALVEGLKQTGAPAADIAKLQAAFEQLGGAIDRAKASVVAFTSAEISEKIAKEKELLESEAQAYDVLAKAALSSAATQREAAARAEAIKFGAANPSASPSQLTEVYDTALAKLNEQRDLTVAQSAAQYDLNASYDQELEKLEEVRSFLEASGESTIAIDTKIYDTRIAHIEDIQKQVFDAQNAELLGNAQLYESWKKLIDLWDQTVSNDPFSSMADRFRAFANEIELEGQNPAGKMFDTFKKGIDDLSSTLAKFVVTGQANWKSLLDSMAESLVKSGIQTGLSKLFGGLFGGPSAPGVSGGPNSPGGTPGIVPGTLGIGGKIAGSLGIKIPGAPGSGTGGRPSGTAGDPLYVIIADQSGNPFGAGNALPITPDSSAGSLYGAWSKGAGDINSSAGETGSSSMSSFFSSISGMMSKLVGSLGSVISSIGSGVSGGLSSLLGIFGLEGGGDVSPGRAVIVGEKRPEVFVPRAAGKIVPSVSEFLRQQSSASSTLVQSFLSDSFQNSTSLRSMSAISLSGLSRRENGGDVTAGMPYLAGESRPEVYFPDTAPSADSGRNGAPQTVINFHVHGVSDFDSFSRSRSQIMGDLHRTLSMSHARNY